MYRQVDGIRSHNHFLKENLGMAVYTYNPSRKIERVKSLRSHSTAERSSTAAEPEPWAERSKAMM